MIHVGITAVPPPVEVIAEVCGRHRVAELAVLGSVRPDDFGPESIVDAGRTAIAVARGLEFGHDERTGRDRGVPVSRAASATAAVG